MPTNKIKKKILITGGSGFIASHVADHLSENGHSVFLLDRKKSKYLKKNQKMIICDILNKKKIEQKLKNIDIVYHFAAEADLFDSNKNPYYSIQCNIIGTTNIAEGCAKNKIKQIIYASSIYALSEQGGFYSLTKLSSEMIIENYCKKYGMKFVILRFGSIYGSRANYFNTIQNFVKSAIENKKITRNSNGREIRNFINVSDVAKICTKIIKRKYYNSFLNIYGPQKKRVFEVLKYIKQNIPNTKIIFRKKNKMKYNYVTTPFTYKLRKGKKVKLDNYISLEKGIKDIIGNFTNEK